MHYTNKCIENCQTKHAFQISHHVQSYNLVENIEALFTTKSIYFGKILINNKNVHPKFIEAAQFYFN